MAKLRLGEPSGSGRATVTRTEMKELPRFRSTIEGDYFEKWRPLGECAVCKRQLKPGEPIQILTAKEGPLFLRATTQVAHETC